MEQDKNRMTIARYRKIMKDETSTDEKILYRIQYLEALCRNVIRQELDKYLDRKLK